MFVHESVRKGIELLEWFWFYVSSKANKGSRKYKSPWYTLACEIARRELKLANKIYKVYKRNRSDETRNLVISKRREYCKAKRKARYIYKSNKKRHDMTCRKRNRKSFGVKFEKFKDKNNTSNLPPSDFFDHFQKLYSAPNMFVNEDATEIKIDQLDRDFCIAEA